MSQIHHLSLNQRYIESMLPAKYGFRHLTLSRRQLLQLMGELCIACGSCISELLVLQPDIMWQLCKLHCFLFPVQNAMLCDKPSMSTVHLRGDGTPTSKRSLSEPA